MKNMGKKYVKTFESFTARKVSEDEQIISQLFNKYEEYDESRLSNISGEELKESLQKIGTGVVTERGSYGEKFMYKEMLDDGNRIFVVHGSIGTPITTRGYTYQISLYKNDPTTTQIGGGYGTSGIITKNHTNLFLEETRVSLDKNTISSVCNDLRGYFKEKGYI